MEVIREPQQLLKVFLDAQFPNPNTTYRKLGFCLLLPVDDGFLALNNLTKECLFLTAEEAEPLLFDSVPYSEKYIELINKYFLVPVTHDDIKLSNQIVSLLKNVMANSIKEITDYEILTTTDCNARCFYCFESGSKRESMSEETALGVVQFILKNAPADKKIHIKWFGGEPLFNVSVINLICKQLSENGFSFDSTMVSNGYLFDPEMIKCAKHEWKLKFVQITLDGTELIYNRRKNYIYKDEISPYQKVMNNISGLISAGIKVCIRLNMDEHNYDDLLKLVDEIYDRFGNPKELSVYPHFLFEKTGISNFDLQQAMSQQFSDLEDRIFELGLNIKSTIKDGVKLNACGADNDKSIMITPSGKLAKCEHTFAEENIGDIDSGLQFNEEYYKWKELRQPNSRCATCAFFPECQVSVHCTERGKRECYHHEQQTALKCLKFAMLKAYREWKENRLKMG